jgi:membrane protease YdiL (CAAX protease family)
MPEDIHGAPKLEEATRNVKTRGGLPASCVSGSVHTGACVTNCAADKMGLQDSTKTLRWLELALVTGVAFAGPVYFSFYYFLGGPTGPSDPSQHAYGVITELLGLSVLIYVLFRQGRQAADIGLSFQRRDIPRALAIAIVGYAAFYACYLLVYYGCYAVAGVQLTTPELGARVFGLRFHWVIVLLLLVNPFFEELIVRAYLMTEIKFLTGSTAAAIAASVGLQTLYHLYQGLLLALAEAGLFLVFALYFSRWQRIMPLALAHLLFDLLSWSQYLWTGED